MNLLSLCQEAAIRQAAPPCPRRVAPLLLCALLCGCATGPDARIDPLEPFNRAVFRVNDNIDQYVAVPLAKGYRDVTPSPVRTAVTNFFGNLGDVGNTINNLLQLKGEAAFNSVMRVAVNTTFGLAGLIDIATPAGLRKHPQDFGLTLGRWHVRSGPYLVLPLFGPSSFRDGVGLALDFQLDPVSYAEPADRNRLFGLNFVNTRTNLLSSTELVEQIALDKYTFVRDAWIQRRQYLIEGEAGRRKLPEYEATGEPPAVAVPAPPPALVQPAPPPGQRQAPLEPPRK
jgi:phospholipid-binding lipoprotein MlaA